MTDQYCVHCMAPLQEKTCGLCGKENEYQAPAHHLPAGTVLRKRYLVGKAIGEGGFGITYIGRDQVLNIRVAVKEYYPNGYSNRNNEVSNWVTLSKAEDQEDWFSQGRERFLQEARTLAQFDDEPGVVGVKDCFEENGTAYIVMDYLDGVTMKEFIRRKGPVEPEKLFAMLEPVMIALEKIHAKGLIHRDISPDNLMLLRNGSVKLLDFGSVRDVTGDKSISVVLKPGYAPEEQYRSKGKQGPWTDVYALCATMYKCITGVTPEESLERACNDELKAPSALGVAISAKQEQTLLQGLQIRRDQRIQDMAGLRKGLLEVGEEEFAHTLYIQRQEEDNGEKTVYQSDEKTVYQSEEKTVYQSEEKQEEKQTRKEAQEEQRVMDAAEIEEVRKEPEKKSKTREKARIRKKKLLPILCGIAAVLAVVLLTSGRKPDEKITAIPGTDAYTLTLAGQIEDQDRSIRIVKQGLRDGEEAFQVLNYLGQPISDGTYQKTEYLGSGLYALTDSREATDGLCPEVNRVSLVDSQGAVLIDGGACYISRPYRQETADTRYLLVYYATEKTENEENCVVCLSQYGDIYTTPLDKGTMYDGYIRIYDLLGNRFLENLPEIKDGGDVQICGNSIVVGSYPQGTMYDPEGNVLVEGRISSVGQGTLITSDGGTYRVYDEKGVQTYYANAYLGVLENSPYITMESEDKVMVMDRTGTVILNPVYSQVYGEYNGIFEVSLDGKYGLVTADGREILPCRYQWIDAVGGFDFDGTYFSCRIGDGYTLVGENGIIATDLYLGVKDLAVEQDDRALVLNERSYDLDLSGSKSSDALTYAMLAVSDKAKGLYGVYDLYTGNRLLECEYETIQYAAGYLYAYKNATWEVYKIDCTK